MMRRALLLGVPRAQPTALSLARRPVGDAMPMVAVARLPAAVPRLQQQRGMASGRGSGKKTARDSNNSGSSNNKSSPTPSTAANDTGSSSSSSTTKHQPDAVSSALKHKPKQQQQAKAAKEKEEAAATATSTRAAPAIPAPVVPIAGRGTARAPLSLRVGDRVRGFRVERVEPVPERNLVAVQLRHEKTGARHLHMDTADTNNLFSVSFRTIPSDSTGVAHILEHTALCGSQQYPVRDPFFHMMRRSLNTYMNAFTGGDCTSYPFSTQNPVDFQNLMSVYMDAAFNPILSEYDFMQEGHRVEPTDLNNPSSPLTFKGVVYNEMKGVLSDVGSYYAERLQQVVFPDNTYGHNSGGEPDAIPSLTYQQLKDFHKRFYHPSNAYFVTYGDLPLENHLHFLDGVLSKFDPVERDNTIPDQPRFAAPKEVRVKGPPSPLGANDPDKQTYVSVAFMTNKIAEDPHETFGMHVLSQLLLSGPNTPLYQRLLESHMGDEYTPGTGYSASSKQAMFSIGVQHVHKDQADRVPQVIRDTLREYAEKVFPEDRVEAILHQEEIAQKHIVGNFGLSVFWRLVNQWMHGGDPIRLLRIEEFINKVREEYKRGPYFQQLIRKWLIDNPHAVTLYMQPDPTHTAEETAKEKSKLEKLEKELTPQQRKKLAEEAKKLHQLQEKVQDASCLPTLTMEDIPKQIPFRTDVKSLDLQGAPSAAADVQATKAVKKEQPQPSTGRSSSGQTKGSSSTAVRFTPQPTNTLVYLRGMTPIPTLPEKLQPLVPLFCYLLTEVGTRRFKYRDLSHRIESYTGGISVSPVVVKNKADKSKADAYLSWSGTALRRNLPPLIELMSEILTSPTFDDVSLLQTLLNQRAAHLEEMIIGEGHVLARLYACRRFSVADSLGEMWGGLSQIVHNKQLLQNDMSQLQSDLKELAPLLLSVSPVRTLTNAQPDDEQAVKDHLKELLTVLPSTNPASNLAHQPFHPHPVKAFVPIPANVNYSSYCIDTVTYTHPDSPKLQVLATLLSQKLLHKVIREQGGAYGGGARQRGSIFAMYSYRDPHVRETLEAFQSCAQWLLDQPPQQLSDNDLREAKLQVFSDLDAPLAPSERGVFEFVTGITDDEQQARRDLLFKVNADDLRDVCQRYLLGNGGNGGNGSNGATLLPPSVAVLGQAEKGEQYNQSQTSVSDRLAFVDVMMPTPDDETDGANASS